MRLRVAALALAASGAALGLPPIGRSLEIEPGVHGISAPLWLMRPALVEPSDDEHEPRRIPLAAVAAPEQDPVVQRALPALLAPATVSFDGIGLGTVSVPSAQAFRVELDPPDPAGDIGPNHYVQIVNSSFAVFSRTGTLLLGPLPTSTVFAGLSGACATTKGFDGIVVYDSMADRWVIAQSAFPDGDQSTGPYWECLAVSRTSDPMGQYAQYGFSYSGFADYQKIAAWPDAYYAAYNMFASNSRLARLLARRICAFERARMLAGEAANQQCWDVTTTEVSGLTPADLDGDLLPPAGDPAAVVGFYRNDSLIVYRVRADWSTPANSSIDAMLIPAAPFQPLCVTRTPYCIPQQGGPLLDALGDRMMFRVAYRNMGGYQSLIANHNVVGGAGPSGGVRWYEIRDPAGDPFVHQQGTYAPDSNSRWMGSAAMDRAGNIGLGFSLSSAEQKVAIGITGRTATDPPGVMGQGETVLAGGGAEAIERWGDYSSLTVDPVDDCTFWYTAAYIPFDGTKNWRTRVVTFQLPGCTTAPDFTAWVPTEEAIVVRGGTASFTVSTAALRTAARARSVQLVVVPPPGSGLSAAVTPSIVTPGQSATVTVACDGSASIGEVPFTIEATAAGVTQIARASVAVVDSDFAISVDKPNVAVSVSGNTDVRVRLTQLFGNPEVVIFSASRLPRGVQAAFDPPYARVGEGTTLHLAGAQFLSPGTASINVTASGTLVSHSAVVHLRTLLQPVVFILDPRPYTNLSGTIRVSVTAGASAGTTLSRIELYVDEEKIQGVQAQTSPAQLVWNTNSVHDGPHYLSARATDAEGNEGSSAGVAIWVENSGPCGCSSDAGGWEALALFGLLAAVRRRKR
jgi:MYXO-CTERM domain-containing protein